MNKNYVYALSIWGLSFLLVLVLMLVFQKGLTPTFWITLAFVCIAFVSTLSCQNMAWNGKKTMESQFMKLPSIAISGIYMAAQIPLGLVFSLGATSISSKSALLVNAAVLIIAWIGIISGISGNDYIQKVNSRQKNHHTEL